MKSIVHVNRHNIAHNDKHGTDRPVFTVKQGKKNRYAREVVIHGASRLVYTPKKPLACGAKAYIVTDAFVECIDEMTYSDVCKMEDTK